MTFRIAIILIIGLILCAQALAQTVSTMDLPTFKWDKIKDYVSTDVFYTHDYISNTGGVKSGPRNIGALDIYVESDFSEFSRVNGDFQLHFIHLNSTDTRASIGDTQMASNIDMPAQVDRIGDLWYQHNISDKFKILVGFHDISMEFDVTESSLAFLNTSFGISADISYSGPNGASVYPMTSVGVRSLYHFTDELSLRTGVYDANPGGEETYRSFHSNIGANDGFMHISEMAHQMKGQKFAVGGWNYSLAQEKIGTSKSATLFGAYGIFEKRLNGSFWTFTRYGWANPAANEIQSNFVTGVVYRGITQKKKNRDEAGLGVTQAHFSRPYMKVLAAEEESGFTSNETAYELYYQFKPMKELSLRPDIQYITNPSGLKNIKNAWATGFRTVVEI